MDNYPVIKQEYLFENNNISFYQNFNKNLQWGNNVINFIQNKSTVYDDLPLSFYPIAKNIRFVASYMLNNINNYKKSIIFNKIRKK